MPSELLPFKILGHKNNLILTDMNTNLSERKKQHEKIRLSLLSLHRDNTFNNKKGR